MDSTFPQKNSGVGSGCAEVKLKQLFSVQRAPVLVPKMSGFLLLHFLPGAHSWSQEMPSLQIQGLCPSSGAAGYITNISFTPGKRVSPLQPVLMWALAKDYGKNNIKTSTDDTWQLLEEGERDTPPAGTKRCLMFCPGWPWFQYLSLLKFSPGMTGTGRISSPSRSELHDS